MASVGIVNIIEVVVPTYLVYKYTNSTLLAAIVGIPLAFFGYVGAVVGSNATGSGPKMYLHNIII